VKSKCHIFEDTDENKLEYTTVHHEYITIMENAIESQLKTEHNISDEEIEAFYTSLKQPDKLKAFEEQNKEIVDNLFGFIDIEKFKAQMISIKRA
jgi:hypothetical protein